MPPCLLICNINIRTSIALPFLLIIYFAVLKETVKIKSQLLFFVVLNALFITGRYK